MASKNSVVFAGLVLALSFGSFAAPHIALADDVTDAATVASSAAETPGVASEATDVDKGAFMQQSLAGTMRSVQGISLVNVSDEMKYFTKYESHGNYDQGFSYGDGYNALGYYQFDRRWSLVPFMTQVYNYNPAKYSMLKAAIDRGADIKNADVPMYANGQLTEVGRIAQEAFQGACAVDPVEFAALQDSYAYNSYYAVTEAWLKSSLGIDISGRADCVKGMVWSITNMCGTGGCQDFFRWANLSNGMSDREFVTALANSVINNVERKYPKQTQYHAGWKNRYRNELKDCLVYIAEDEAEARPEESGATGVNAGAGSNAGATEPSEGSGSSSEAGSASGDNATEGAPSTGGSSGSDGSSNESGDSAGSESASSDSGASAGSGSASNNGNPGSNSDTSSSASDSNGTSASSGAGLTGSNGMPDGNQPSAAGDDAVSDGVSRSGDDIANNDSNDDTSGSNKDGSSDNAASSGEQLGEKLGTALTAGLSSSSDSNDDEGSNSGTSTRPESNSSSDNGPDKSGTSDSNSTHSKAGDSSATTSSKKTSGDMPRTGDLVIMASLASASLATLGMTAIVHGKNKMKDAAQDEGANEG